MHRMSSESAVVHRELLSGVDLGYKLGIWSQMALFDLRNGIVRAGVACDLA